MLARRIFKLLAPPDIFIPSHLPRVLLSKLGYFRFRTWLAAHGKPIPDANLYMPLYSPWEGEDAFMHLYRRVRKNTLVSRDRCYVLWQTLQQAINLEGDVIECGVFRGGTALLEAMTLHGRIEEQGRKLHLFDSFAGFPRTSTEQERFGVGDLANTSVEAVQRMLAPYSSIIAMHIGFIPDTFQGSNIEKIAWAHIDVDLYKSVHDCIDYIYPRLLPSGFMIFDDYGFPSCAGARQAVDEAFANRLEKPLCLPTGQAIIVKLAS